MKKAVEKVKAKEMALTIVLQLVLSTGTFTLQPQESRKTNNPHLHGGVYACQV